MPNARARSAMFFSPCCVSDDVEMPHLLWVTMIRIGTSLPGREDQMRHAAALRRQQAERDVERLFARAADPEVTVTLLVHLDQALFEDAGLHHELMHPHEQFAVQRERFALHELRLRT